MCTPLSNLMKFSKYKCSVNLGLCLKFESLQTLGINNDSCLRNTARGRSYTLWLFIRERMLRNKSAAALLQVANQGAYTTKNSTDLLQGVNFTGLQQSVNFIKLLLKSGFLLLVICKLVTVQ